MEKRRHYINENKPRQEQARRLRLLQPVVEQTTLTALVTARRVSRHPTVRAAVNAAINALHRVECGTRRHCTWDGHTIFPVRPK